MGFGRRNRRIARYSLLITHHSFLITAYKRVQPRSGLGADIAIGRALGIADNVVLALEASHGFPGKRPEVAGDEAFRVQYCTRLCGIDSGVIGKEELEISHLVTP